MKLADKARPGTMSPASAPAPAKGNKIIYDDTMPGFGLRVTAAGAKAFVFTYRFHGRHRRITIGKWPAHSVLSARNAAKKIRQAIDQGHDPLAQRIEAREAPTVGDMVRRYEAEWLPRKRPRAAEDDRLMASTYIISTIGRMKVAAVDHAMVDKMHREITADGKPYRANRVLALLSKQFSMAIKWGWCTTNPCKGIERNVETPRARYLSDSEITALKSALVKIADRQASEIIWLLLLTGARKGEIFAMRWADLDLVKGRWTKPASTTKQKKTHTIPLNPMAVELLSAIKKEATADFVFPGRGGVGHISDIKHSWSTIRRAAGLDGVRLHDLRHSHASILASVGMSLPVIGALLGHSNVATTARYAHLTDDTVRAASELLSNKIRNGC